MGERHIENAGEDEVDARVREKKQKNLTGRMLKRKILSQGMFDIALLSANASYMKLLWLQYLEGNPPNFFHLLVTLLVLSFILQIMVGIALFAHFVMHGQNHEKHEKLDSCSITVTALVLIITVINVLITTFSDHSLPRGTSEQNTPQ
ncbi:ninjurin-1-like [Ptychodera flava]|uniref:ninjurin-1-like n=1 Tax=Ptychodera flava TaxID=63121 RepID=UPI003969FCF8